LWRRSKNSPSFRRWFICVERIATGLLSTKRIWKKFLQICPAFQQRNLCWLSPTAGRCFNSFRANAQGLCCGLRTWISSPVPVEPIFNQSRQSDFNLQLLIDFFLLMYAKNCVSDGESLFSTMARFLRGGDYTDLLGYDA
jgi:hypothetical protein